MKFLDLKYDTFGLDINDLSLKIAKLKKKRNGFVLTSFNEVKIAPGIVVGGMINNEAALVKIIKSAYNTVKGKKIKTKYVLASLPEEKSFLQVIQMPKMTNEEFKLAVPLEAENYIPMPIEDVYLDYQVIRPIKDYFNHSEILIVAMPKKIVDSYVSCFKKAGLKPVVFEAESQAISRALVKKGTNTSVLVLIDFGENHTNFVVFSGQSIRFTCAIPISSQMLTKAISQSLKIDFKKAEKLKIRHGLTGKKLLEAMGPVLEELVAQVKKYLYFYHEHSSYEYLLPGGKEEKILLCGGGSELKGLADFLSKSLEVTVELGDPQINLLPKKYKSLVEKNLISFTTAIGLALE